MKLKITKKSDLLIERERTVTIRFGAASGKRFCAICRERAAFVTIDEAAIIRQSPARQIFRLVESDLLHSVETENGLLLVCLASLARITDGSFLLPEKKNRDEY